MSFAEMESSRYMCCVGPFRTHVEKGAFVIAFLGSALNIIEAIVNFLPDNGIHQQNISSGVMYLFGAVMYLSIILAQQKRNHILYLPYLIYVGIGLVASAIFCFVLFVLMLSAPQAIIDQINKQHPEWKMTVEKFRVLMGASLFGYAISCLLNGWFYSVVYRAYKYMKEEFLGGIGGIGAVPPV